ncbi:MAG: galactokinase [Spirochaetaceae bacterium]|nr:galactokinase [Spirochaetaceae bacterium]
MKEKQNQLIEAYNRSIDEFKKLFKEVFISLYGKSNKEIIVSCGPARINIIGEHIDNYGGNVFPAAIDKYLFCAIRKRNDATIYYDDLRFPGRLTFSLADKLSYKKENSYGNYLNGMVQILRDEGYTIDTGFEVLLFSLIPEGGGISSSAALEMGFGSALVALFNLPVDNVKLALLGKKSENEFMNVKCGIMDQFASSMGKANCAIDLNCATLEYTYVPIDLKDYCFVVMNSNKVRTLAGSEYNSRREDCEKALDLLQKNGFAVKNLCEIDSCQLETVRKVLTDDVLYRRALHCITENAREKEALTVLNNGDLTALGELLKQSHASLRDNYEVSCLELDTLVDFANNYPTCLGSRLIGAGFGGCCLALVAKNSVQDFIQKNGEQYREKIGYDALFFECLCAEGARVL